MHARQLFALAGSALALAAASAVAPAPAAAGSAPGMSDFESDDFLVMSAWGRQNNVSRATCTGLGRAGNGPAGPTHSSFRCDVRVGAAPAGVVVAKVLGPQSLRVVSVSGGKLKPDRGIGPVPKGRPVMESPDANVGLSRTSWAKANRVSQFICSGVGPYRATGFSQFFYAFSCATFDSSEKRGPQVLVKASGKRSVRVVRVLAR